MKQYKNEVALRLMAFASRHLKDLKGESLTAVNRSVSNISIYGGNLISMYFFFHAPCLFHSIAPNKRNYAIMCYKHVRYIFLSCPSALLAAKQQKEEQE